MTESNRNFESSPASDFVIEIFLEGRHAYSFTDCQLLLSLTTMAVELRFCGLENLSICSLSVYRRSVSIPALGGPEYLTKQEVWRESLWSPSSEEHSCARGVGTP